MAEDKLSMVNRMEADGSVSYSEEVISVIAGLAANEIDGVAGMSGGIKAGINSLLGKSSHAKGVKSEIGTEEASIEVNLIARFGSNVRAVAQKVQENVKRAVESMTGLHVTEVNVNVQGMDVQDETTLAYVK